jgi:hypothetical protein
MGLRKLSASFIRDPGLLRALLPSLLGAALLSAVGWRYRIDSLTCSLWPPWPQNVVAALVFLLAVALLSLGWRLLLRRVQSPSGSDPGAVLLAGCLVYVVAALGPPALSEDPLFYAAIGRAQAEHGASPYQPLCEVLASDDALLARMIPHWRCGRSPYLPGFNGLAWLVAVVAKGDLIAMLRGFQAIAGGCLLLAGALTAWALRGASSGVRPSYGAALVIFNPVAVIEGPASGHNDALLALATSGFVLAWQRRSVIGLGLSQAVALSVKASSVLLLGLWQGALLLRWLLARLRRSRLRTQSRRILLLALLAVAVWLYVARPESLLGPRHLPWEHCTRSIECLPRSLLRSLLHLPRAAFAVAVSFRLLAVGWLLYVAWRAAQEPHALLPWLGAGLLLYYLYLHPWSQSWYLLSLLPLAPWLHPRMAAVLRCLLISAAAYYALVLIGNCLTDELAIAALDLAQALIVLVPPTVCLLRPAASAPT